MSAEHMERWCETACAVVNGMRRPITPAQAAVHAINWERICDETPTLPRGSNNVAMMAAGAFDDYVRRIERHDE